MVRRRVGRLLGLVCLGLLFGTGSGCGGKEDPDLIRTASGLKYKDIEEGKGEAAKTGDLVSVHYTGKLRNGKMFDQSKEPFEFRLGAGKVIKGWDEGVVGMKIGGVRKLVIPPELGYGAKDNPGIPANSELHFEVEMVHNNDSKAPKVKITEIEEGKGETAKVGQRVAMHYTGTLKDGTKFDSSLDRGNPFIFNLGAGEVIRGWDQGIPGMKVGGKRKLIIPSELAYGSKERPSIPPNSELTFEVELLEIRASKSP